MQERVPITAADREWRRQRRLAEINAELARLRQQFEMVLDSLAVDRERPESARRRTAAQ